MERKTYKQINDELNERIQGVYERGDLNTRQKLKEKRELESELAREDPLAYKLRYKTGRS